jgi:shikimate kinase
VLVGPPGAGKSSVGNELAAILGVGFRDTDADVERRTGKSVSDIFVEDGEASFRALEEEAVAAALADHPGVLALGAGAILSSRTRDRLEGQTVVHLHVGLAAAMSRLEMNRSRPLLLGNVRGRWQELSREREPVYQALASVTVDTDGRTPREVAEAVAAALNGRRDEERPT